MKLKVVFVSLLTLLVALAVNPANASPNRNQILELKIGKFSLTCKGNCSDKYKFRDYGDLTFGVKNKIISDKNPDEHIQTYNLINDFPNKRIPQFCIDGSPDIKIGLPLYENKPSTNTFPFFSSKATSIGVYTSSWGATGWGNSITHIFDTETGEYFTKMGDACDYPTFVRNDDNSVAYYINKNFTWFLGPPNFSLVYLDIPFEARDLKGKFLLKELTYFYERKLFQEAFRFKFFSERELRILENIASGWNENNIYPLYGSKKYDQGERKLLERLIILIGYDILIKGYKPLQNYFKTNTFQTNQLKIVALAIAQKLPEFGDDLNMNFYERYE